MIRVYEYTKDQRGNYVTDDQDAPYRWFAVSQPRSTALRRKGIVACLDTFINRKRFYITGLIRFIDGNFYLGDIKDETIIVWMDVDKLQMVVCDGPKGQSLSDRKQLALRVLKSLQ